MLAEIGFFFLILSSLLAGLLAFLPLVQQLSKLSPRFLSLALFTTIATSFTIFVALFVQDDFSVQAVAHHSNTALPLFYKISASWGSHQGSMFLWTLFLSLWLAGFAFFSAKNIVSECTFSFFGLIIFSFLGYLLIFSDPFARLFPAPLQGGDLNPMLQDLGLIIHPPLLYLGYSGFALVFAFTLSALFHQQIHQNFARMLQNLVRPAWGCLTLGILVGCGWAYYELGWGGWWFWDPSENASLMPWLLSTGLIHSLNLNSKKNTGFYWTLTLALSPFLLTLLGTFIIRSGVLISIHSFNNGSSQSSALLTLFALFALLALTLFVWKGDIQQLKPKLTPSTFCLLLFNILLTLACFIVWLGSFYPLFYQAFGLGKISVGSPYFNGLVLPIIFLLMVLLAFLGSMEKEKKKISLVFVFSVLVSSLLIYFYRENYHEKFLPFCWLTGAIFVICFTLINHQKKAMTLSHLGVMLAIIGAVMSSYFSQEKNLALPLNEKIAIKHFVAEFQSLDYQLHPNYTNELAQFSVSRNKAKSKVLTAEKRYYDLRGLVMSEVGILPFMDGDLYLVMGDKLGLNHYRFQLSFKPFVSLLWLGGILMSLGAFVGLFANKKKVQR